MPVSLSCPSPRAVSGEWEDSELDGGKIVEFVPAVRAGEPWESLHQMVSQMVHGVKNPLGVLLMGTEYLEKKAPQNDLAVGRVAEDMRHAIARADAMVRALRDLLAAETPDRQTEDLSAIVEAALAKLEGELAAKEISVAREFSAGLPPLHFDRRQGQQAIVHLLTNAIAASPRGGTLAIRSFPAGEAQIHLVIEDAGSGIPAAILPRVFEPFFTTAKGGRNAGLGLTVARKIIHAHGGTLSVTNREPSGVRVSVVLAAADFPTLP
jgi:signal transduction histidine kinase